MGCVIPCLPRGEQNLSLVDQGQILLLKAVALTEYLDSQVQPSRIGGGFYLNVGVRGAWDI